MNEDLQTLISSVDAYSKIKSQFKKIVKSFVKLQSEYSLSDKAILKSCKRLKKIFENWGWEDSMDVDLWNYYHSKYEGRIVIAGKNVSYVYEDNHDNLKSEKL